MISILLSILQSLAHPARFTLVTVPAPGPAVPQHLLQHCLGRLPQLLASLALSLVFRSFGRRHYTLSSENAIHVKASWRLLSSSLLHIQHDSLSSHSPPQAQLCRSISSSIALVGCRLGCSPLWRIWTCSVVSLSFGSRHYTFYRVIMYNLK